MKVLLQNPEARSCEGAPCPGPLGTVRALPGALLMALAFAFVLPVACSHRVSGWGNLTVTDLDGRRHQPLGQPGQKAAVFVFLANDCPIANRAAPEIQRLHQEFAPHGVSFWMVHANADETPESIRQHAREYSLPGTLLRDPQADLARLSGVHVTPEAAVVLADGRVVYRGRLDNRFIRLGVERTVVTSRDVAEVLSAVVAGREVASTNVPGVGCHIPGVQ